MAALMVVWLVSMTVSMMAVKLEKSALMLVDCLAVGSVASMVAMMVVYLAVLLV